MRSHRSVLFVVLACAALAVVAARASNLAVVGSKAPPLTLSALADGKSVTLKDLEDRAGVIEFWATWCPPCRESIPHLIEVRNKYPEDKLAILGITDEDAGTAKPFVDQMKMNYAIMLDVGGKAGRDYGCDSIPRAFVVDADGKILWEGNPLDTANFDAAIEEAVKTSRGSSAKAEAFPAAYAALVASGEGADKVIFDLTLTGGKKPARKVLIIGSDRKATFAVKPDGGAEKAAEIELSEKDHADLLAALKAAEFDQAPAKVGDGKPGAVVAEVAVRIGEDARKTVVFVTENSQYATKGAKNPEKLVALWRKLESAAKKAEGKAK